MTALYINKDNFRQEVLEYKGTVLVDFFAEWCGPCRMTGPIIDELSLELKEVKFVKVDVDNNPELASQYSVFSIPTFLIFKNGKLVSQFAGAVGKERFIEQLKTVIGN